MKAIVDPLLLIKELKKAIPVVGKNQILPVLGCVKLDFSKKELTVTATDLNTWVGNKMPCENKSPFEMVAPLDELLDICSKASGPILITHSETSTLFEHHKGKIKIPVSATPKEFSKVEEVDYFIKYEVDGSFFHAISGANVCRLKDDQRPHLSAIGIDFRKDKITVIGTDGHLLYKHDFPAINKKACVVSIGQVFADVTKSFQTSTVSISDKFIKVESGDSIVISRLNVTKYVDYDVALTGSDREFNISVSRTDLLSHLDVIDMSYSKTAKGVLFTLTPNNIHMFAQDEYIGKEGDTELTAMHELTGSFRVKGDLLKRLLNTITEERIKIMVYDPTKNIYIQPEDNKDILLSIMPLMINA